MSANMRGERSKCGELPSRDESQIHRQRMDSRIESAGRDSEGGALGGAGVVFELGLV